MSDLIDVSPPGQLSNDTLAAARAFFYNAGTTTLRTVFADEAETVPHPSPLVADADGLFPQAFVSGGPVKVVMQDSAGPRFYTMDPAIKVASAGQGASSVSFTPTLALPFTNVQAAIEGAAATAATGFAAFGLGVTGSVALLAALDDTNIASGLYRFDATTTGTYPTGVAAADTGAVRVERETSGSAWMVLYHDTTDRVFIRRMTSSTWGAWRENITANIGAVEGDLLYRTSTAWTRLAKGTAAQVLRMNAGATAPEWFTPTSGAPSTTDVLNATAGAALGAVGTYAFLAHITANTALVAGTTYSGSSLRYSGYASNNTNSQIPTATGTPSGTWMAMGSVTAPGAGYFSATLFLRVS